MKVTLKVEVHTSAEYAEVPDHALIEMDDEFIARIFELQNALQSVKATYIKEFDYRPDYRNEDGTECMDFNADCVMLTVSSDDFYWTGYIKHTSDRWETDTLSTQLLKEAMEAPVSKLAKLVVDENQVTKKIAQARLKEGNHEPKTAKKHRTTAGS